MSRTGLKAFAEKLSDLLSRLPLGHAPAGERAVTDSLSGLLNRAGFEAEGARRLAADSGLPVSAVVFDIDAFAAVNRTSGPAAGDRIITALGSIIREAITDRDVAGRIGGEAFAVLLTRSNLSAARLFAEAVRTRFDACDFGREVPWSVTVSAGVAECRPGEKLALLVARADQALYTAKQGGRDRVVVATEPESIDSEAQTA